jgi:hypothetical protein
MAFGSFLGLLLFLNSDSVGLSRISERSNIWRRTHPHLKLWRWDEVLHEALQTWVYNENDGRLMIFGPGFVGTL